MSIAVKRVYDAADSSDGVRILVDRLWPRGLSKERARIDHWVADVAPSNELRKWYGHAPEKWPEFRRRYFAELDANPEGVEALRAAVSPARTTFVFSSKETELNNAHALKEYLER
jgi:uncharacterized protein YeaO (DUF488 family)